MNHATEARSALAIRTVLSDETIAAFSLLLGGGVVRLITVEVTAPFSLHPYAVLCDGEPIPVNARDHALFDRATDAMAFALEYCGWGHRG